jgi:protein-S-isoprenylcysteine O-methyltransferase Ste14
MLHDPSQLFALLWSGWTSTWPTQLLAIIWILWIVSWAVASFWSGRTEKYVMFWASRTYRVPIIAGAVLLAPWTAQMLADEPVWHVGNGGIYALAGLTLAGISFAWCARIYLGRFWSSAITRKEGHQVIDTGPYGLVRHPIYTGLIGATLAMGVALATVTALLGALLIAFGLWQKARMEEDFLTTELGPDAYARYYRRVPMLVPFLPHRRTPY